MAGLEEEEEMDNHLNVFLCVKHLNQGKLSSHMWFIAGFCQLIDPQYFILLDCGTQPTGKAVFNLFRAFEAEPQIGI
jgi:chitin synthase